MNGRMELPSISQQCRIRISTESTSTRYGKDGMIEVFLISIESVTPDVAPPTWFTYFCVSLWPISRCCVMGVLASCRCSTTNYLSRLRNYTSPEKNIRRPMVSEHQKFHRQTFPTKVAEKHYLFSLLHAPIKTSFKNRVCV